MFQAKAVRVVCLRLARRPVELDGHRTALDHQEQVLPMTLVFGQV
jgi:hypothetical protein